jgi:hypothetical protein
VVRNKLTIFFHIAIPTTPDEMASKYDKSSTGSQVAADFADHINGKIILVTGVSPGGLGAIFAETVAKAQPAILVIAGRNTSKVQQTADTIKAANPTAGVKTLELDLSSLKSVRRAADEVNGWGDVPHIDVLVNNAGIMAVDYGVTEDGFERQFGTNHLGPFLFTNLLMDKVLAADVPRVIVVSSDGHRLSPIRWTDHGFNVSWPRRPAPQEGSSFWRRSDLDIFLGREALQEVGCLRAVQDSQSPHGQGPRGATGPKGVAELQPAPWRHPDQLG